MKAADPYVRSSIVRSLKSPLVLSAYDCPLLDFSPLLCVVAATPPALHLPPLYLHPCHGPRHERNGHFSDKGVCPCNG